MNKFYVSVHDYFYIAAIKSVIYFFNSNLEILFRLVLDTQNLYIFNFHFRVL